MQWKKIGYRTALMTTAIALAFTALSARRRGEAQDKPADVSAGMSVGTFPNDSGPTGIDVSSYPKEMQSGYRLMLVKCSACHTIARPINSQYLELTDAEMKQARIDDPDLFKDKSIVQPEVDIWKRYVKRMMSKPGCPVGKDGKKIYDFLVYDSNVRKTGKNAAAWRASRRKLDEDFKKEHPDLFKSLFVSP